MIGFKEGVAFIEKIRHIEGSIWVENDSINLSLPESYEFDDIRDFIGVNKKQIRAILCANSIFSSNVFLRNRILKSPFEDIHLLSHSQERLWFIDQYEGGSDAYNLPLVYELTSEVIKEGVQYALTQIINRHEVLHSTICKDKDNGRGVQVVGTSPLEIENISCDGEEDCYIRIREECGHFFNLSEDYPIRVRFYSFSGNRGEDHRTFLVINIHHIACDGWSLKILQQELISYYEAYIDKDKEYNLLPLDIQYKDYAVWQRSYLTGKMLDEQLKYWKEKLLNYEPLQFQLDFKRPSRINYCGAIETFILDRSLSKRTRELVRHYGVTMHSLLLGAINIFLGKYTGQNDIVTGSPIANRHYHQTENLIGFFVNTLVNRIILAPSESFEDLIKRIYEEQIIVQKYQDLPFERLISVLNEERDLSRHPVFQIMFGVQSFGESEITSDSWGKYFRPVTIANVEHKEKFDLSIFIDDSREELRMQVSYATSLFTRETILRLVKYFERLLDRLTSAPQNIYSSVSLLDDFEYNQIVRDWNATDRDFDMYGETIVTMFEKQVLRDPDKCAVRYEDQWLSYGELNRRSNQLAGYIRKEYKRVVGRELGPDTLVCLYLDKSVEMIVGILGVLKSGGAYVPIDPSYPLERVKYLLKDTGCAILLSHGVYTDQLKSLSSDVVVLGIDMDALCYTEESEENPLVPVRPNDLAYVIYTSGTTGTPKGVMIEHKSLVNLVCGQRELLKLNERSCMLQYAALVFDASVWEIFSILMVGGELSIVAMSIRQDSDLLIQYLAKHRISVALLPPAIVEVMRQEYLPDLEVLVIGGDTCSAQVMHDWSKGRTLFNAYGPTESTVIATMHKYGENDLNTNIGRPIYNGRTYVLDESGHPVAEGVVGELYIGGACLARGYLNRKELTKERFVDNPFAKKEDAMKSYTRLYKTGDLVRWLPGGNLEFGGRNDNQVKIRGYRIELEEIESVLSGIEGIKQGCVVVKDRQTDYGIIRSLVTYCVLGNITKDLTSTIIRQELEDILPLYMVPDNIVLLDSFPINVNGKIDYDSLPSDFSIDNSDVSASTTLELKVANIYAKILGLPNNEIGINQNFFKLGGNSILTLQLKDRLKELNEFKGITVADLFKYNSISKLIQGRKGKNTEKKSQKYKGSKSGDIAIVGFSGVFSGANDINEFWSLLKNQQEGIKFLTKTECRKLNVEESWLENPNYIASSGMINDIDLFDPNFWEVSPQEAKELNPQIRKFVEHCWFTLESAGYANLREKYSIGMFAASGENSYYQEHILNGSEKNKINPWRAYILNNKDALATKTSFLLNLTGPSYSINTACSSSLVAVIEACKNLQVEACDMALAGGVSIMMPDKVGYIFQKDMILSKDGHCKPFDKDASGTTAGSGVGVVLLKRVEDAVLDGDQIFAVVKGHSINNDGNRKISYTAPSVIGQRECILQAQSMAEVKANDIQYVECHGTGTLLGDPIEIQALQEAFESNNKKNYFHSNKTLLGAVKANIGHADTAAGIAGVIKLCLMLQNNLIPGQVNFKELNPELNLEKTRFKISKQNCKWMPSEILKRLAGVSSFGIGGTNAHVIIGDYYKCLEDNDAVKFLEPSVDVENAIGSQKFIIPFSARSLNSLEGIEKRALEYIKGKLSKNEQIELKDIAYTLQFRREHFNYRKAYCVSDINELVECLKGNGSAIMRKHENSINVVFMFPGQGGMYVNIVKNLYQEDVYFKTIIDECIGIANKYLEVDLLEVLYPRYNIGEVDINETQWSQICFFIIEYSIAQYLQYLGLKPNLLIGHSIGEYAAATIAGILNLEDSIRLVITRGKLMHSMEAGSMLSVRGNFNFIKNSVELFDCDIAAINSGEDVTISGQTGKINDLKCYLEEQSIPVIKLQTSHAYHSKSMTQAAEGMYQAFKEVKLGKPSIDIIATSIGTFDDQRMLTSKYWCDQIKKTVLFGEGIEAIFSHFKTDIVFFEVGPGKGLSGFVKKYIGSKGNFPVSTINLLPSSTEARLAKENTNKTVLSKEYILSKIWETGISIPFQKDDSVKKYKLLRDFPNYQFDYVKCWIDKEKLSKKEKPYSIDELYYERFWRRINLEGTNHCHHLDFNLLIFINDPDYLCNNPSLLNWIHEKYNITNFVFHSYTGKNCTENSLDLTNFNLVDNFIKNKIHLKENLTILYLSATINLDRPADDIISVKNIFSCLFKYRFEVKRFISVSTNNFDVTGDEHLQAKPSIIYGISKSIPVEYFNQNIKTFHLDVSSDKEIVAKLCYLIDEGTNYGLIAFRGDYGWVPFYRTISNDITKSLETKNELNLNEATIIITGGLGGVGYSYANHILEQFSNARIILVGRTEVNHLLIKNRRRFESLRMKGNRIDYFSFDIGNMEGLPKLTEYLKSKEIYKIDIVLHAAGVSVKSALFQKNVSDIEKLVKGKVLGVENLIALAGIIPVSKLINCSSLSSIIPSIGNLEYTAANLYLDEICYRRHEGIGVMITLNLNKLTGLGKTYDFLNVSKDIILTDDDNINGITSKELCGLLDKILSLKSNKQIAISRYDIEKDLFEQTNSGGEKKTVEVSKVVKVMKEGVTNQEFALAKIFAEVLGVDHISLEDDFFTLGGDSIAAILASQRISREVELEISVADIFRLRSISGILKSNSANQNGLVGNYKDKYDPNLLDFIFFPPALAGPEMYQSIAQSLCNYFNCIWVKNYNIENNNKIYSVDRIASLYINEYKKVYSLREPILLFGWSLGGFIALEVAGILEKMGYENIQIFLLDAFVPDTEVKMQLGKRDTIQIENLMLQKYEANYVRSIIPLIDVEERILNSGLSKVLEKSVVHLYKAVQKQDWTVSGPENKIGMYWQNNEKNNIDKIAKNILVTDLDCDHFNMIEKYGKLISNLIVKNLRGIIKA